MVRHERANFENHPAVLLRYDGQGKLFNLERPSPICCNDLHPQPLPRQNGSDPSGQV
jgi:hypothetical protein